MDDIAIKVENVSKTFRLPRERNTSIKSAVINFYRLGRKGYIIQKALKDVSFEVKRGEFYGIIGRNGGGKSTLLKLLAGIYTPTTGTIAVNGQLTPFIELGVGFNMELTGRENVYLNGALLGFNRREMRAMYKDIVEFAELEKFMDQKLKNYSSGMQVRLAFSIAIRARTDILLIDEVLAVGDANFQKKCINVFQELKRAGKTIIFVSHSMGYIKDFCDRVLVIKEGDVVFDGDTAKAVDIYNQLNLEKDIEDNAKYNAKAAERLGSGGARIKSHRIYDEEGKEAKMLNAGQPFSVKLEIDYRAGATDPVVGVMFRRSPNENLYGLDNHSEGIMFGSKSPGNKSVVEMKTVMPLAPGEYLVSFSVIDAKSATDFEDLDILNNILRISVVSANSSSWSLVRTPTKITEQVKGA